MRWFVASISLIFMVGAVSAHTGDHSNLPEPGTTPGSPFFGLEQAQESIGLALTFNSEKKAHKRLHIAQKRLSEAKKLSESNDSVNTEKAVQKHSKAMEKAEQAIQNLPEDRRDNASKELNSTRKQSFSVLQNLKQKLPESAMTGIDTAIEAHRQKGVGNEPENIDKPDNQPHNVRRGYMATSRVVKGS